METWRGVLPDSSEGWPWSPLETKSSRRWIRFSTLPVELWVLVNMRFFFFRVIAKNYFGNIELCFSALFCWQENWISTHSFPTECTCFGAVFFRAFLLNEQRFLNRAEKQVMHYALCWLYPVNNAIKMPQIKVRRMIWGLIECMYLWIIPRCWFLSFFLFLTLRPEVGTMSISVFPSCKMAKIKIHEMLQKQSGLWTLHFFFP